LRARPAGEAAVRPGPGGPATVQLDPPGRQGVDRLRLRFGIDDQGDLQVEVEDLETQARQQLRLGPVR
ncbi:MAG: Hsp70 family protein, partial [Cyanobacteriota bacterium]